SKNITILAKDKTVSGFYISKKIVKTIDFFQQFKDILKQIPCEYKNCRAEIVLSSENVILRYLKLPLEKTGVSEIIYWELIKLYSTKLEQYYWNFQKVEKVIEDSIKKQNYKIELASKSYIDAITKILSEYKIKTQFIISEETVLENLISIYSPDALLESQYFLLKMDSENITLIFFDNNRIKYKRSFESNAEIILKIILNNFKEYRENIFDCFKDIRLLPYCEPDETDTETDEKKIAEFSSSLKTQFKIIADEIKKTETFLKSNYKIAGTNQVFLTGDFSEIKGIAQFFKSELNKTVQIYSAPDAVSGTETAGVKSLKKNKANLFYSLNNLNEKSIIKLNEQVKKEDIEFEGSSSFFRTPHFIAAACVLIISLLILPNYFLNTNKKVYETNLKLNSELKNKISDIEKFLASQNIVSVNKKFQLFIETNNYDYFNIFSNISNSVPQGIMFEKMSLKTLTNGAKPQTIIAIQGWSSSPVLIPSFIVNLDKTNLFFSINLDNSSREPYKSYNMTRFEITAVLKEAQLL
nr:PilN domain-containing protein [bacterium]